MYETVVVVAVIVLSAIIFLALWFGMNKLVFGYSVREQIRMVRSKSHIVDEVDTNDKAFLVDPTMPGLDNFSTNHVRSLHGFHPVTGDIRGKEPAFKRKLGCSDNGPVFFSRVELEEDGTLVEELEAYLEQRAFELGCVAKVRKVASFNGIHVHWEWV